MSAEVDLVVSRDEDAVGEGAGAAGKGGGVQLGVEEVAGCEEEGGVQSAAEPFAGAAVVFGGSGLRECGGIRGRYWVDAVRGGCECAAAEVDEELTTESVEGGWRSWRADCMGETLSAEGGEAEHHYGRSLVEGMSGIEDNVKTRRGVMMMMSMLMHKLTRKAGSRRQLRRTRQQVAEILHAGVHSLIFIQPGAVEPYWVSHFDKFMMLDQCNCT